MATQNTNTEKIIQFSKSLVVKSGVLAYLTNKRNNIQMTEDRAEWKYYKNLAGEYHTTDTKIKIKLKPNTPEVILTKALLNAPANLWFKNKLLKFGKEYDALIADNPSHGIFIFGCLFDIDIQKAIEVEDGSLLAFNTNILEKREVNVPYKIEQYIKNYFARWEVADYAVIDYNYYYSFTYILFSNIVTQIKLIQLDNRFTPYVNNEFIYNHLESHFRLSSVAPILKERPLLWLYNNIDYLSKNVGTDETIYDILTNVIIPTEHDLYEVVGAQVEVKKLISAKASDPYFTLNNLKYFTKSKITNKLLGNKSVSGIIDEQLKLTDTPSYNSHIYAARSSEPTHLPTFRTKVLNLVSLAGTPAHGPGLLESALSEIAFATTVIPGETIQFKDYLTSKRYTLSFMDVMALISYILFDLHGNGIDQNITQYSSNTFIKKSQEDLLQTLTQQFTTDYLPFLKTLIPLEGYTDLQGLKDYLIKKTGYNFSMWGMMSNITNQSISADVNKLYHITFERKTFGLPIGKPMTYIENHNIDFILKDTHNRYKLISDLIEASTGIKTELYNGSSEVTEQLKILVERLTSYTTHLITDNKSDILKVRFKNPGILSGLDVSKVKEIDVLCQEDNAATTLIAGNLEDNAIIMEGYIPPMMVTIDTTSTQTVAVLATKVP